MMPMLLALYLLVLQLLVPAPGTRAASASYARGDAQRVEASALVSTVSEESARGNELVAPDPASHDAVAWVRVARPFGIAFTTRASSTPRTAATGATLGRLSMAAGFAASVRARTLADSHAVGSRGALLPYYPTAPPLQG